MYEGSWHEDGRPFTVNLAQQAGAPLTERGSWSILKGSFAKRSPLTAGSRTFSAVGSTTGHKAESAGRPDRERAVERWQGPS